MTNSKLKISIIGPGIISIPPPGWGAVESLVWDYYIETDGDHLPVLKIL